jgi:hypothetical protein
MGVAAWEKNNARKNQHDETGSGKTLNHGKEAQWGMLFFLLIQT